MVKRESYEKEKKDEEGYVNCQAGIRNKGSSKEHSALLWGTQLWIFHTQKLKVVHILSLHLCLKVLGDRYLSDMEDRTTRVSAFREILQSLQCKIVQYTFLGQYLIKLQDFFSQCKIPHPAWIQLHHNKLGLSGMRLFRPLYHKTEKTLFQMWCTALKKH